MKNDMPLWIVQLNGPVARVLLVLDEGLVDARNSPFAQRARGRDELVEFLPRLLDLGAVQVPLLLLALPGDGLRKRIGYNEVAQPVACGDQRLPARNWEPVGSALRVLPLRSVRMRAELRREQRAGTRTVAR